MAALCYITKILQLDVDIKYIAIMVAMLRLQKQVDVHQHTAAVHELRIILPK